MRSRLTSHALLSLMMLAASVALAADKPKKESSFGGGKPAGAFLTKEQLRACLVQQLRVTQQDGAMQKEQAALTGTKAELARSGETLKGKLDALDRTDAQAVAAYNDEAQARDKQIDDYQAGVTAFNTHVDALAAERDAFGKACSNRRYFEEDEIAIKKGK